MRSQAHSDLLPLTCNYYQIEVQLKRRLLKFIKVNVNIENVCVKSCMHLAINIGPSSVPNSNYRTYFNYNTNTEIN